MARGARTPHEGSGATCSGVHVLLWFTAGA